MRRGICSGDKPSAEASRIYGHVGVGPLTLSAMLAQLPQRQRGSLSDAILRAQQTDSPVELDHAVYLPEGGARWVETRARVKPVLVHAGWRTDLEVAVEVVVNAIMRSRTPEPVRRARELARRARAGAP